MREPIFEVKNMNKSFGIVKALKDVSMAIYPGEIRGLIGENGSGKSTVSSIIAGIQDADSGEMFYQGKPFKRANTVDAQKQGVSMIVQEIGTIGSITVAQNIFLGRERDFRKGPFVSPKLMVKKAQDMLNRVAMGHIDASLVTAALPLEDRKLVELARAMQDDPNLLIVDETTTALSQAGRERLYGIMQSMARDGKAILFISHDLDELMQVCDTLTVLRDGVIIGSLEKAEFEKKRIKQMMVGREVAENYYRTDYEPYEAGEVALKAEYVSAEQILENFSLELHKGEILGVGGLSSCGMHELGRVLFGAEPAITGQVTVYPSGNQITDIKTAILNRIGYVSKNRDEEALILRDTIGHNLTASALHQLSKWGVIPPKA
ncbi:MAG: ATP-binding cassette domain-containing protein, partial [Lachnospiraceae bacterium]|nr:ATP-binding cassette domain-containing protein [Lachnospiraceae bacterium]